LPDKFRGQVSPNLSDAKLLSFQPDDKILPLLLDFWKREFVETNSPDWKRLALFSSLEMAYQASRLPANSMYTTYDFGTPLALWVSAFEVLVHPGHLPDGEIGRADLKKVICLLGQASWHNPELKQRNHQLENRKNTKIDVNLVQKLYGELYGARNDFLHGNPVAHSRLFCFCNENRRSLIEIAPVIYQVALSCFFGKSSDTKETTSEQPNYKEYFDRCALENALLATLEDRK
jgi:hypothetical protein